MLFDALLVMPKNSPINGHFALFVCEVPHTRWKNKALGPELGGVWGRTKWLTVATALVESSLAVCTCSLLHLLTTGFGTNRRSFGISLMPAMGGSCGHCGRGLDRARPPPLTPCRPRVCNRLSGCRATSIHPS